MNQHNNEMLRVETDAEGVRYLIFDAQGEAVNTLRAEFAVEFAAKFDDINSDDSVVAVVLLSAKAENFIAGADISMLARVQSMDDARELSRTGQNAVSRIADCRVPVVAAIHGACLGGGLEIALACHARLASSAQTTKLGLPEVQLGILPGMGGTVRLPQLIGVSAALDLLLTGKQVSAKKALQFGLVDQVVPPGVLRQEAKKHALLLAESPHPSAWASMRALLNPNELREKALADNPLGRKVVFDTAKKQLLEKTHGNYPAPERILSVVKAGLWGGAEAGYAEEATAFGELVVSKQAAALRHVYFCGQILKKYEKRDHAYSRDCRRMGVLGAGLMGTGVTYVSSAHARCHVRLKDVDDAGLSKGLRGIERILAERVIRRRLTERERTEIHNRITCTRDWSGFAQLDVVIEAVFEDLALKRQLLGEVERVAPQTIFASNTSSLPIASIALHAEHPERVIGMHYFSPVHRMPLLEIIATEQTAGWVIDSCVDLGRRQGKTVIVVGDGPGFYTTRILGRYLNEATFCLTEGMRVEDIDQQLVLAGFPVGPLTLLDEIGIDVGTKVGQTLQTALGERLAPPPQLAQLLQAGRLGRKNKCGFYDYGAKTSAKRPVDASVYEVLGLGVPKKKPQRSGLDEPGSVAERCLFAMVNEAAYCLGEGVLKHPRDGDVGAIYGLGFPPYLGGPFHFVDALGAPEFLARLSRLEQTYGARFAPAPQLVELAQTGGRFFAE